MKIVNDMIKIDTGIEGYSYDINLCEISTEKDLLKWALHLTEKTWMDTRKLRKFIQLIASHKKFDVYGL